MKKYNKEELEQLILVDKISYEEIGRRYDCTGSNIKKVAKKLGIDLPQRRKINENETFNKGISRKSSEEPSKKCLYCGKDLVRKVNTYCNVTCEKLDKQQKNYQYFLNNPQEFQRANFQPSKYIKKQILKEQDNKCIICGQGSE